MNPVHSILHRNAKHDKLNILLFTTDPLFECELAKTDHNFYAWTEQYGNKWPDWLPMPANYHILTERPSIGIDCILCQDRGDQYILASKLSHILHVPKIVYTNIYTAHNTDPSIRHRTGDLDVFASEQMKEDWKGFGWMVTRYADIIQENITESIKPYCLPSSKLYSQLGGEGNVFVHVEGPAVNQATLNAMGRGHIVIVPNSLENGELIKSGKNGFLVQDLSQIQPLLQTLSSQPNMVSEIREAALKTIEQLSFGDFITSWNDIFSETQYIVYTR